MYSNPIFTKFRAFPYIICLAEVLCCLFFCIRIEVFRQCILIQFFTKFKAFPGIICPHVPFYLNPIVLKVFCILSCSDDSQRLCYFVNCWHFDSKRFMVVKAFHGSYMVVTLFDGSYVSWWLHLEVVKPFHGSYFVVVKAFRGGYIVSWQSQRFVVVTSFRGSQSVSCLLRRIVVVQALRGSYIVSW